MNKLIDLYRKYKELILYVVFGGLTTAVSFVSYWVFADLFHIYYMAATVLSWVVAVTFAYVTNRKWVFESKVSGVLPVLREMASFFASRLASGGMELFLMFAGVDLLHINDKLVKLFANVLVVIANYILSKLIVFRGKEKVDES